MGSGGSVHSKPLTMQNDFLGGVLGLLPVVFLI